MRSKVACLGHLAVIAAVLTAVGHSLQTQVQRGATSQLDSALSLSVDKMGHTNQRTLSQTSVEKSTVKAKKQSDPFGIGGFFAGCTLIPFALVLLWKNEAKVVTFAKCISDGRKACLQNMDPEDPDEANEFELVHLNGTTEN